MMVEMVVKVAAVGMGTAAAAALINVHLCQKLNFYSDNFWSKNSNVIRRGSYGGSVPSMEELVTHSKSGFGNQKNVN